MNNKQQEIVSIAEKVIENNKALVTRTLNKYGNKEKWLTNWLINKINPTIIGTEEYKQLEVIFPRQKYSLILAHENIEFQQALKKKLVLRYGLSL